MRKTRLFTNIFVVILSLGLMWGCQSTAVGPSQASQKENLLVRSGFKAKTVTTPKQQQRVVGNQTQYNAYKQSLVAYGLTTSPDFVEETHGPHRILIQQFDGFGPLGE